MKKKIMMSLALALGFVSAVAYAGGSRDPFEVIPPAKRQSLKERLDLYVKNSRTRKWVKLYDLVSDVGRGSVNRRMFVASMNAAHGRQFASDPDLLGFQPDRSIPREDGGYDIYGCGKARREGEIYRGIAVVHALLEHDNWFFTGWSFTEFPNEPCKDLSSSSWQPEGRMEWDKPMEELRSQAGSVPIHVDQPK